MARWIILAMRGWPQTFLVLSTLPFAVAGSVWLLAFMDYNLSTAVWVGLIAVAGVGVLATLVNLVNPSVIVIGGALAVAGEGLLAGIREEVYRRSPPLATANLTITTSQAGERAGVIGAAALAIHHVLSPTSIDKASYALTGG